MSPAGSRAQRRLQHPRVVREGDLLDDAGRQLHLLQRLDHASDMAMVVDGPAGADAFEVGAEPDMIRADPVHEVRQLARIAPRVATADGPVALAGRPARPRAHQPETPEADDAAGGGDPLRLVERK